MEDTSFVEKIECGSLGFILTLVIDAWDFYGFSALVIFAISV